MVSAIILAAGMGKRMGNRPKALLTIKESTFLELVVTCCRDGGCDSIVVVTANGMDKIVALAQTLGAKTTINNDPGLGMFSSVIEGIRVAVIENREKDAVLIHPVDHPTVTFEVTKKLLKAFFTKPDNSYIKPVYKGRGGHPVVIDVDTARALLRISPDKTLRDGFATCAITPHPVDVDDPGVTANCNTPEDLEKFNRL